MEDFILVLPYFQKSAIWAHCVPSTILVEVAESSSSFDLVPLYRRVGRSSHRVPSILQIRVGASLELVEEPVDLVDFPTEAPQLRVVGVALLDQLVSVLVQGAADGVALVSAHRD